MREFRTITAEELREALEGIPGDALVAFASDYGDRGNTQQIHRLRGRVTEETIEESGYSDSGFAIRDTDEDDDEPDREAGQGDSAFQEEFADPLPSRLIHPEPDRQKVWIIK